jgi:hypothetical protein
MLLFRILRVLVGALVAYVDLYKNEAGTFLGFYPPNSGERVGADLAHAAFFWLAGWLIYRGFRPAVKRPVPPPQA